jgi:hypothetical protein
MTAVVTRAIEVAFVHIASVVAVLTFVTMIAAVTLPFTSC